MVNCPIDCMMLNAVFNIISVILHSTHYQTTNFRLFQTERVCRRQFQICRKWKKAIQTGGKHCGKRRNSSLRAISLFPSVFKKLVSQGHHKVSLCGNGLTMHLEFLVHVFRTIFFQNQTDFLSDNGQIATTQ